MERYSQQPLPHLLSASVQSDHDLSGNEDPNILHAYIAYLPSKVAYKEGESILRYCGKNGQSFPSCASGSGQQQRENVCACAHILESLSATFEITRRSPSRQCRVKSAVLTFRRRVSDVTLARRFAAVKHRA